MLSTKPVQMVLGKDKDLPATLVFCTVCGCDRFTVYQPVNVKHWHYLCASCSSTYCDVCFNDPYNGSVTTTPPAIAGDDTPGKAVGS